MEQRKTLHHHEIRVIKINREAIIDLIRAIIVEVSGEIFQLPHIVNYMKKVQFDVHFDEQLCEVILSAYRKENTIKKDELIAYINSTTIQSIDSLFLNFNNDQYYCTTQDSSLFHNSLNKTQLNEVCKHSIWRSMLKKFSIRTHSLGKFEVRFIRISKEAIHELLWEHFMKTGDKAMDIPVGSDDVIYHMYTEGALQQLTLYVMNLDEASDKAFAENRAYCDKNIPVTTDSYFEGCKKEQRYVSVILSE